MAILEASIRVSEQGDYIVHFEYSYEFNLLSVFVEERGIMGLEPISLMLVPFYLGRLQRIFQIV